MAGDVGELGADLVGERLGLGRQVDGKLAANPSARQLHRARAFVTAAAGQRSQGSRALQVEVRVVFPREADSAEHLHAVLGAGEEVTRREDTRDRGNQVAFVV
jgi:hypothetical protein